MEFLKELFNGGALTYDQLAAAAKGKGCEVVNAAQDAMKARYGADLQGCGGCLCRYEPIRDREKRCAASGYGKSQNAAAQESAAKWLIQQTLYRKKHLPKWGSTTFPKY